MCSSTGGAILINEEQMTNKLNTTMSGSTAIFDLESISQDANNNEGRNFKLQVHSSSINRKVNF